MRLLPEPAELSLGDTDHHTLDLFVKARTTHSLFCYNKMQTNGMRDSFFLFCCSFQMARFDPPESIPAVLRADPGNPVSVCPSSHRAQNMTFKLGMPLTTTSYTGTPPA